MPDEGRETIPIGACSTVEPVPVRTEGVVSNEQDKERRLSQEADDSGGHPSPSTSSDLLDLVRSAEDEARLAIRKRTPATATMPVRVPGQAPATAEEEFVDVGDEAIDAPPSFPPLRLATPAGAFAPSSARRPSRDVMRAPLETPRGMPPVAGIVLVLSLAVVALALFTR